MKNSWNGLQEIDACIHFMNDIGVGNKKTRHMTMKPIYGGNKGRNRNIEWEWEWERERSISILIIRLFSRVK